MRSLIIILFVFTSLAVNADGFKVFEKDGYFGIKDETGNVTVPAVYEKLGWSNGSTEVVNGVIGFRLNNQWGLITARNKALTGQRFYTIEPINTNYFKASIKGKFSNHLFHGILDEKGKTVISFNYFTIEPLGANWLVSDFDGRRQQFGVVSFENELIVPTKYSSVYSQRQIIIGRQHGQKLDLFSSTGQQLQLDLDSIQYKNGWVAFRDGYAGYLTDSGAVQYEFEYKSIQIDGDEISPIAFSNWSVYHSDTLLLEWRCDSLMAGDNGLLVAYLNGAHHLLLNNETLLNNHELNLKEVAGNTLIVQNTKTRKWSILNDKGVEITSGYDSIYQINDHFGCLNEKGWNLLDKSGGVKNRLPLQALQRGVSGQYLLKRNDHWGVLEPNGKEPITYKYDSIVATENQYIVSYLNRWGVLNAKKEWVIRSEYNEVISIDDLLIGRRGMGYSVHYEGQYLYKTIAKPLTKLGSYVLIQGDSSKYGLMDQYGEVFVQSEYDSIKVWSSYIELSQKGIVTLIDNVGREILSSKDAYQEVKGVGEGYFLVKKEDRCGFIDDQGRLRISNRYDDARPFEEGLAPVMLRGKWGFINKSEEIKVQPYYQEVTPFIDGRAIVMLDKKYGLVDMNGGEVLELIWKSILRVNSGSYIVQDMDNRFGLVDKNGSFIFRPSFDYLEDYGDRVLVSKNGKWGVLNYARQPIFKVNHEDVRVFGNYTMIKN